MNKKVLKANVFKSGTTHSSFGPEFEIYETIELHSLQNVGSFIYAWLLLGCRVEFYFEEIDHE